MRLADQPGVAGLGRMAPRRRQVAAAGQRQRDAPVQRAPAGRILGREQIETVVAQQRMQTPHGTVAVDGQQQTVQGRQRGHPRPGIVRPQHVIHQIRIDPVEDRQLEQAGAVLRRQVAQQMHADVVAGKARCIRAPCRAPAGAHVPIDHQRDGPAGRALLDRGQLSPRQVVMKEPGDVGFRKTEILHTEDERPIVEDVRGQIESGIRAERHGEVEIPRSAFRQQLDQPHRTARKPVDLVEHEQARRGVQLDGVRQHAHLLYGRRRGPGVMCAQQGDVQAGVLESGGEVAPEQVRRVVTVQGDPASDVPLLPCAASDVRQHGGLAETARRLQYREPPFQHPGETLQQRRPAHVSGRQLGRHHLRPQQPGCYAGRGRHGATDHAAGIRRRPMRLEIHERQQLPEP